jgi:predicted kinase
MVYYILIRGPPAVGKTTVATRLARRLRAHYISIDATLKAFHLDTLQYGRIPRRNFLRANDVVVPDAIDRLRAGQVVILDGNFYYAAQIQDLIRRLSSLGFTDHVIFSLEAPLQVCVARDASRPSGIGARNVRHVYRLTNKWRGGVRISTASCTAGATVSALLSILESQTGF